MKDSEEKTYLLAIVILTGISGIVAFFGLPLCIQCYLDFGYDGIESLPPTTQWVLAPTRYGWFLMLFALSGIYYIIGKKLKIKKFEIFYVVSFGIIVGILAMGLLNPFFVTFVIVGGDGF